MVSAHIDMLPAGCSVEIDTRLIGDQVRAVRFRGCDDGTGIRSRWSVWQELAPGQDVVSVRWSDFNWEDE